MNALETGKLTDSVDGWLTHREGSFLYNAAKKCPENMVIVEIGSWKGKSALWLGKGFKDGNKVKIHAIDQHSGSLVLKERFGKIWTFENFKENIKKAKIDDVVKPLVKTCEAAAKSWGKRVCLLWIDRGHGYERVLLDYKLREPHRVKCGVIAFHDSQNQEPKKVVNKHLYFGNKFKNVSFAEDNAYAIKVDRTTVTSKIKNLYALLLTTIYSFAGKPHLPNPVKTFGMSVLKLSQ